MNFKDVPNYHTFTQIEQIHKGWSDDQKYYIENAYGEKLLLRISDITEFERKKSEYNSLCELVKKDIPMSVPKEFGICNDGKNVYMLLTWIEGEDAQKIIPTLPVQKQYELGLKAGQILKQIHSIPSPPTREDWALYFNKKINRKIEGYKNCGIHLEGEDRFFTYIDEHRHLLVNRIQSLHHGDYHIGNMIITPEGELSIIDFNRLDNGDPWEEFNRIVWCASCSKYFASGRIDGYFNHDVPYLFWQLLALYISSNTLSSIYWAIPFGKSELETMINQFQDVLDWYDQMSNPIPKWYESV